VRNAEVTQHWPSPPDLLPSVRMESGQPAAVSEKLEPVCPA
jgi:hypothetical protein